MPMSVVVDEVAVPKSERTSDWTASGNRCTPWYSGENGSGPNARRQASMKQAGGDKMKPLTVIAKLKAKQGCEEQLGQMLRGLVEPTRAEKGCINYDLHRSHEDPGLFIFYEIGRAGRSGKRI